ncbi:uncharacterized protein A4U43_C08F4560 [Asparagus officinalis]|uniref:uncharacterized protein LOC109819809 n=1 Tax=Asparagus officinalis TaxID=4686 RepID=UPI00098DEE72|nr:uncharacterized protein LOC109819809 [Asparagus officinalis]ONK59254.1 uncharacterized protein A4U43_C08F4560 [Asparagus officinalis]
MGCVCSRGEEEEKSDFRSFPDEFSGIYGCGIQNFDSGELRMTPARAGTGKVSEMSSIIGRAGIASLERAVEVLDTLGSSMSNLKSNSGFISGVTTRGNKISILAFEVANTIAKGATLLASVSEENIEFLKKDVLKSDGIRRITSAGNRELMIIAAADKRHELDVFAAEVIRFGNLCKDPVWHNLDRYFQKLGSECIPQEQLSEEVETSMQQLINLVQDTSELYHESHALDRFEQDYQRKLREEEAVPATSRESLMILHTELKRQRKLVKSLKKKSLWSRNLEEVVECLVDVVVYLHKVILDAFGVTDANMGEHGPVHNQCLGVSGLALHYANVIAQIDNIVSRPLALPANTRDSLYQGLPPGVKAALRSKLQSFDAKEEYTAAQIKAEMQKTLRWLVPLAENTIRAHQGFGWVGEWANICTETNKNPSPQHSITRIQTLYHADKEKTEECILELAVWLHHLVLQVRNKGYKSMKPARNLKKTEKDISLMSNGKPAIVFELSEEDREMLGRVDSKKTVLVRSKSQELAIDKDKRKQAGRGLSRSFGNSPSREFNMALESHLERTKVLDILDGLHTAETFSR